jgi:hypothetical protein
MPTQIQAYVTQHPQVHQPLETHYDFVVEMIVYYAYFTGPKSFTWYLKVDFIQNAVYTHIASCCSVSDYHTLKYSIR